MSSDGSGVLETWPEVKQYSGNEKSFGDEATGRRGVEPIWRRVDGVVTPFIGLGKEWNGREVKGSSNH
jgi:hypothetical protein